MNGVPLIFYLALGLFMFTTGVVGVVIRRNPIVIFMCIELMLNAVNLTFLSFARYQSSLLVTTPQQVHESAMNGQMMVIFVMAVAAADRAGVHGRGTANGRIWRESGRVDRAGARAHKCHQRNGKPSGCAIVPRRLAPRPRHGRRSGVHGRRHCHRHHR